MIDFYRQASLIISCPSNDSKDIVAMALLYLYL